MGGKGRGKSKPKLKGRSSLEKKKKTTRGRKNPGEIHSYLRKIGEGGMGTNLLEPNLNNRKERESLSQEEFRKGERGRMRVVNRRSE